MADPIRIEELFLTSEDEQTLKDLAEPIAVLEKNIAKAERAGLDVTQAKADLAKAKELREGVLRELTKK